MNDAFLHLVSANDQISAEEALPLSVVHGKAARQLLRDGLLCEVFAETKERRPDALALKSLDHSLTYGELDVRSDSIRRGLLARGVGPGDIVGLWMPRGTDVLIVQLGIAKTGAAWLPFDAEAPIDQSRGLP